MSNSLFISQVRQAIRMRGYSLRTEKTYAYWVCDFIRYNKMQHPNNMGPIEVNQFLSYLANNRHVAVNTQKNCP